MAIFYTFNCPFCTYSEILKSQSHNTGRMKCPNCGKWIYKSRYELKFHHDTNDQSYKNRCKKIREEKKLAEKEERKRQSSILREQKAKLRAEAQAEYKRQVEERKAERNRIKLEKQISTAKITPIKMIKLSKEERAKQHNELRMLRYQAALKRQIDVKTKEFYWWCEAVKSVKSLNARAWLASIVWWNYFHSPSPIYHLTKKHWYHYIYYKLPSDYSDAEFLRAVKHLGISEFILKKATSTKFPQEYNPYKLGFDKMFMSETLRSLYLYLIIKQEDCSKLLTYNSPENKEAP